MKAPLVDHLTVTANSEAQVLNSELRLFSYITWSGVTLFFAASLLTLSAYRAFRFEIKGLLVHPFLVVVIPVFFLFTLFRLFRFPIKILIGFFGASFFYVLSCRYPNFMLTEGVKLIAAVITVITVASLVRSRQDFKCGALGMCLAMAFLALTPFRNLQEGYLALNPMHEVANENAFSLFALPALLMAGYIALDIKSSKLLRFIFTICISLIIPAIFMGMCRSGWLGCFAIIVMLWWRSGFFRLRSFLLLSLLTLGVFYLLNYHGTTVIFERRVHDTFYGYNRDLKRWDLFMNALQIGLQHPFTGVSPQQLNFELGQRIDLEGAPIDSHNVIGHMVGASGLITFFAFFYLAQSLWIQPKFLARAKKLTSQALAAHDLLRMTLLLWLIRGMFTREVLYAPGFCFALGFAIGLCLCEGVWNPSRFRIIYDVSIKRQPNLIESTA